MWSAASHVHHLCYQAQETMQSDTALVAQADMRRSFPAVAHAQPSFSPTGVLDVKSGSRVQTARAIPDAVRVERPRPV
jgi:hypothetical protein